MKELLIPDRASATGRGASRRRLISAVANLLSVLHVAIIVLFVVGWAAPWREVLWAVVVGALVVRAGWWIFEDQCLLSILEERLRAALGAEAVERRETEGERKPNFVADTVTRILGRPMPVRWVDNVTYGILWSSFSVASLRLAAGWA